MGANLSKGCAADGRLEDVTASKPYQSRSLNAPKSSSNVGHSSTKSDVPDDQNTQHIYPRNIAGAPEPSQYHRSSIDVTIETIRASKGIHEVRAQTYSLTR